MHPADMSVWRECRVWLRVKTVFFTNCIRIPNRITQKIQEMTANIFSAFAASRETAFNFGFSDRASGVY
jgi:hypothetical protein